MRRSLFLALLVLVLPAVPAFATVTTLSGEPPDDLRPLLDAERHFCARAKETSIRDAFYEALDDNAIVFHGGPVNGKDYYKDRPSNPGPTLWWEPKYAEIANSGDLGWTTGPWVFTAAKDKKPSAYGHFATVWHLGLDHKWHVLIDFGNSHPATPAESLHFARVGGDKVEEHIMGLAEFTHRNSSFAHADSAYSQALAHDGMAAALSQWADPDVRVYRDEQAPYIGVKAASDALAHEWDHGAVAWGMMPGAISKSGDLAFSYGTVDLAAGKKGEPTRRNIMRIWRKAPGEDWRLALDVTIPVPPDAMSLRPGPPPTPEPKAH